jgi:hypothetical protein
MNGSLVIKKKSLLEYIFFSNYFYGICAVALSVEASLQQHFPLNGVQYFGLIFIITVLYYAYPYIRRSSGQTNNPRTNWYRKNYNLMRWNQIIITIILIISTILFLSNYGAAIMRMRVICWLLLLIFPAVAAAYYGINFFSRKYNLRKIGWLKPFIIGFTWAGLVTVYPVLFHRIINEQDYQFNWISILLFLKNFMFIAVLCIMFDIKDYASDCLSCLKTFVVKLGLRKTIFAILLPLSIIGLAAFIWYGITHHFHEIRIILNIIPFILLGIVAYSLHKRRSLLYYLSVVDGLMLAKAICGTIAIKYF